VLNLSNWLRLLSLQKKLLIDAGREEQWNVNRDWMIARLRERADVRTLQAEAFVGRRLTEAKISIYSGKKGLGVTQFVRLFLKHPVIIMKRLGGREMTDVSRYLLNHDELDRIERSFR
jgi:hypothetical protein